MHHEKKEEAKNLLFLYVFKKISKDSIRISLCVISQLRKQGVRIYPHNFASRDCVRTSLLFGEYPNPRRLKTTYLVTIV